MRVKLIKQKEIGDYYLILEGRIYHTNPLFYKRHGVSKGGKLSLKNCDELFGVVDVDKLADDMHESYPDWAPPVEHYDYSRGVVDGFNKAMEFNKDKLFTLEDITIAYNTGYQDGSRNENYWDNLIQSLQQPTEIDVEIVMEYYDPLPPTRQTALRPKLDSEGCLILKKI